ncbi:endonuclease/exonuclease/phosphatase family protein [Actinoplanes sp. L3-i22]|uniref:endonuclease/exonuclease/phosphatase family protein n=1 Tax=Actinoplanes sp. L3-i22 TaxID=2836373 RepID=UPI001C794217|nr:endonuclease/exonuclease/phosphatase family protein [Actinoplanes sp. L3-i22]BCY08567.1 teicoplanin resistance protein VanJ [Actinoplanes sp. L3-i22]
MSVAAPVAEPARTRRRPRLAVLVPVVVAAALTALLAGHRWAPGSVGSGLDSGLPWLAVPILALLGATILVRRIVAVGVALVPLLIWTLMFGPALGDRAVDGRRDLRVASLNLGPATAGSALDSLLAAAPDLIVLQEITAANRPAVTAELGARYPFQANAGTVALFSRLPLSGTEPVDIQIGWTRALRTTVTTPSGQVRVYAAHLASARAGRTAGRNRTLSALAGLIRADPAPRLLLAGDLNTATSDRHFDVLAPLTDTQQEAGAGFGFTWPARFPLVRPDHLLQRGMTTRHAWVLSVPGSDHRAVLADLDSTAG